MVGVWWCVVMVPGHRTCHIPVYPLVHTAVFRISDLCQLVYVILWVPDDSVVCLRVSRHGAVVLNMYHALACPGEFRCLGCQDVVGREGQEPRSPEAKSPRLAWLTDFWSGLKCQPDLSWCQSAGVSLWVKIVMTHFQVSIWTKCAP